MTTVINKPSWSSYEEAMHSSDAEKAAKAADAFDLEREKEMKNSRKAREWEKDRKASWAKDKPAYIKKRRSEESENEKRIIRELKDGGHLMGGLRPAQGLVLIKDKEKSSITDGGLIVPDSVEYESNLAYVVRVGSVVSTPIGQAEKPCVEGDVILYRKGSGLNLKINGEAHKLIRFDEVFGVVEE